MNSFWEEVLAFFTGEILPLLVIGGMIFIGVVVALVMIILMAPVFVSCVIFVGARRIYRKIV